MKNRILLFILLCIICVLTVSCLELLKETTKNSVYDGRVRINDTIIRTDGEIERFAYFDESLNTICYNVIVVSVTGYQFQFTLTPKNGLTIEDTYEAFLMDFGFSMYYDESAL
ncbi:MAG: hypothetical protein GY777_13800 [Candidatus Brocadiaceae bacterium]|nr:hypothetical protein [Candidatus Brocadiaceae bacterium]